MRRITASPARAATSLAKRGVFMLIWVSQQANTMADKEIKIGDCVRDKFSGHRGIVVKIEPHDSENHGTIYVWQMDRYDYGADNCEHYCHENWRSVLIFCDPSTK
jgi:heat shock protein HspQ